MTEEKYKKAQEIDIEIGRRILPLDLLCLDEKDINSYEIHISIRNKNGEDHWITKLVSIRDSLKKLIIEDLIVQIEMLKVQFKEL